MVVLKKDYFIKDDPTIDLAKGEKLVLLVYFTNQLNIVFYGIVTKIFLDIMLLVMNGIGLVETLRANPKRSDFSAITISCFDLSENERNCLWGQIDIILTISGIEPAVLLQKLRELVVIRLRKDLGKMQDKRSV